MYFNNIGLRNVNIYVKKGETLPIVVYADNFPIVGPNVELIKKMKLCLQRTFDMIDLHEMNYFVGLQVCKLHHGLFISQSKYALDN